MPGVNQDNLPTFSRGGDLTAADLNRIVDALRQQKLVPGSFQTGSFFVQRPVGVASTADTTARDEVFGYITTELQAATTLALADAGTGMAQEVDDAGDDVGSPVPIWNRHFNRVALNVTVYWDRATGEFLRAGCSPKPT